MEHPNKITLLQNLTNLGCLGGSLKLYKLLNIDDYFTILDSDDYWIDNIFLQRSYDFLNDNPNYFVYSEKTNVINHITQTIECIELMTNAQLIKQNDLFQANLV